VFARDVDGEVRFHEAALLPTQARARGPHRDRALSRSRPTTGRLPPRPDSDLRSHRGQTSTRLRVRPVPAPRVRRLRHLPPRSSPTG
jgi:hypothetical protein